MWPNLRFPPRLNPPKQPRPLDLPGLPPEAARSGGDEAASMRRQAAIDTQKRSEERDGETEPGEARETEQELAAAAQPAQPAIQ